MDLNKLLDMPYKNFLNKDFNIAHFQGKASKDFESIMLDIKEHTLEEVPEDMAIISIWTSDNKCILNQQLQKNNINLINCYIPTDEAWTNPYKIQCILKTLKSLKTKYALILDGYDVVINSFKDIISKFESFNAGVVFNASKNNYPFVLWDRSKACSNSKFRYLNAGCCIGYTDKLIEFYEKVFKEYQNRPTNRWNSEQLIVRRAYKPYKDYSDDYNLIKLDTKCDIFQTFGQGLIRKINDIIYIH